MHLVRVSVGTRGDVQAFVALGKGLAGAGLPPLVGPNPWRAAMDAGTHYL
jgi:hypothetical protein